MLEYWHVKARQKTQRKEQEEKAKNAKKSELRERLASLELRQAKEIKQRQALLEVREKRSANLEVRRAQEAQRRQALLEERERRRSRTPVRGLAADHCASTASASSSCSSFAPSAPARKGDAELQDLDNVLGFWQAYSSSARQTTFDPQYQETKGADGAVQTKASRRSAPGGGRAEAGDALSTQARKSRPSVVEELALLFES